VAQGWDAEGRSTPCLSCCSVACLLPGQCARGQERAWVHCLGLRPPSSWMQSWLPVRMSPGVNSMALLQWTALPCDNLNQLGWALHPLLVSYRARRALGKPLGPGLASGNGWLVFWAACQAKGMNHCKRDTHTPRPSLQEGQCYLGEKTPVTSNLINFGWDLTHLNRYV